MMDKALKAKWIAALRSGEFVQGHGRLQTENGYCCLGVLCVVGNLPITPDGRGVMGSTGTLDYDPIRELLGDLAASGKLTLMNDLRLYTFPEIADWVEANL